MTEQIYDIAIIGGGPAGLTAAIYGRRAGLKTIVFSSQSIGSQLLKTESLENFPGFVEPISGYDLLEKMRAQALRLGAEIKDEEIVKTDFSKATEKKFILLTSGQVSYTASSVIAATGAVPRSLGLEAEKRLLGHGISTCAVCDGFFFRGKETAVIGGGDTAIGDAIYLSKLAKKVYLIHRRNELRAAKSLQEKLFSIPNITVLLDNVPVDILGENKVSGIKIKNVKDGKEQTLMVEGVFVAVGQEALVDIFGGQLKLTQAKTIEADEHCRTSISGVFAAGDVSEIAHRQAIVAAAAGAKAALEAVEFLKA